MADPTRAAAKGAIKTASTEGADPELAGALSDAGKLRIELAKEDLIAGSLYSLKANDYPTFCKGAAMYLLSKIKGDKE